jgi:hypothetical protein
MREIKFIITTDQIQVLCDYYGKDVSTIQSWEVCEMLDELIVEVALSMED